MIGEVIQIGDQVIITIEKESREWGYNPCPDGTKATVVGFSDIYWGRINNCCRKPGLYINKAWVKLKLKNGQEITEWSGRLKLVDQKKYENRVKQWREDFHNGCVIDEPISPLPETPFWEGDQIRVRGRSSLTVITSETPKKDPEIYIITRINYHYLKSYTNNGSKWPAYDISDSLNAGWHTSANEDDIKLVERGNVWKYYHNEPLTFPDLEKEANFFYLLGEYKEMRNPKSGNYAWTKDEILIAIGEEIVDGFMVSTGLFGFSNSDHAIKYYNEDLGRRVRNATLTGFRNK